MSSVAALVLAAGAGRRMGGPKALLRPRPGAPTLLETVVGRVRAAGCEDVLVVVGAGAAEVGELARSTGARTVLAEGWDEGMGASLRTGLTALGADLVTAPDVALVTLVDLPDVGPEVMVRVLESSGQERSALARATYDGEPGHPVVIGRDHWAAVRDTATGDRGARDYLRTTEHRPVECGDLATGRDVDTADDLARGGEARG